MTDLTMADELDVTRSVDDADPPGRHPTADDQLTVSQKKRGRARNRRVKADRQIRAMGIRSCQEHGIDWKPIDLGDVEKFFARRDNAWAELSEISGALRSLVVTVRRIVAEAGDRFERRGKTGQPQTGLWRLREEVKENGTKIEASKV